MNYREYRVSASILLLLFFSSFALGQNNVPAFIKDSLDAYINHAIEQWQVPGVAICIVKDGQVIVAKGYGVKEYGTKDRVDANTLFMIGSNTKAFTATAIATLDYEHKLSLDDKVRQWLPDFKLYDPLATQEVTVRDLLCHRLGLTTFQGDFTYWGTNLTRKEVMQRLGIIKPVYGFRTKWGYTNAAFLAAGEIIPKVTGQTWEAFVKERFFTPLQMNNSHALATEIVNAPNAAKAHTLVNGQVVKVPYPPIDNLAPAASISSSVNDMSHWLLALLDSGKYNGLSVIPYAAIKTTRVPQSIIGAEGMSRMNESHFSLYGLGWDLSEYAGKLVVSHTGGVNGFVTSVTLLPEEKLGIVILTNTDQNWLYEAFKSEIMDAYLGLPYRGYSDLMYTYYKKRNDRDAKWLQEKQDTIAMHLPTALPLKAFTGTYNNTVYGKMNIELEKNKLVMHFSHHTMVGNLEALEGSRFLCTYTDPIFGVKEIPFSITNGKVSSVIVKAADFVEYTTYEFVKE